jgi:hypothetical protein
LFSRRVKKSDIKGSLNGKGRFEKWGVVLCVQCLNRGVGSQRPGAFGGVPKRRVEKCIMMCFEVWHGGKCFKFQNKEDVWTLGIGSMKRI